MQKVENSKTREDVLEFIKLWAANTIDLDHPITETLELKDNIDSLDVLVLAGQIESE